MSKYSKEIILNELNKLKDENNCIDIATFRKNNPAMYSILGHYFNSVDDAIETTGGIKVNSYSKTGILRDKLCFDKLEDLRKEKWSFAKIADKYGVSRSAVNALYHKLNATQKK